MAKNLNVRRTRAWLVQRFSIEMVEPRHQVLVGYPEAWSPSTPGEIVAAAISIAGRSASDVDGLRPSLDGAAILQAAAVDNFIRESGAAVRIRVNVQARLLDTRETFSVTGEIPGADPALRDDVVMLGAHLDSWHTAAGATDNADGVAASLEAFRVLQASGVRLRRTVRLALWGAEEQGLLGSRAWVAAHLAGDANAEARRRLVVYFNIDPGKGPIYGWYLQGDAAVAPVFDAWLAPWTSHGARRNVARTIGSTDHLSFIAVGVPGFNPVQEYTDYDVREHHTNVDTAERIRIDDLKQNAAVLASFVAHAANRATPLPSDLRR
jgi:hypothetical protein